MSLKAGTRLGPYEIGAPIGAGGMGEVYRARDTRLERDVAIKVLPERMARDPEALARFEREARAVAALSHPNILAIHDFGVENGTAYSVTEMLEGQNLRERMAGSPLPPRKAIEYALQAARGLAAAHDKGIVHRDLKPDNLFVTEDGQIKILDFGLAKQSGSGEGPALTDMLTVDPGTQPGTVLGTMGYMSPEQVRGQTVDHRTDLFAFGTILYEMLSGRRAFRRDTAADTMTAILKEDPPDLSENNRNVPPALEGVIRHCLEKNPAERFQSARDLAFHLEALGSVSDAGAVPALPVGTEAAPAGRRNWWMPLLILTAGLLAGAAAGLRLGRPAPAAPPTLRNVSYSGSDRQPSASPDGRLIAYASVREHRPQIWLKQFPGGDEAALTAGPDERPRISPDGTQVLFVRDEGGRFSLYRVPVVGGEPRKVLDDAYDGDWSPDGGQVVFLRTREEGQTIVCILGIVDPRGQGAQEIARVENARLDFPRWSPDGDTIAAVRSGTENAPNTIFLVDGDGGNPRSVTPPAPAGLLSAVAWTGNGSALVYAQANSFAAAAGTSSRIIRQDVGSGRPEVLMWIPARAEVIDISGPGSLVVGTSSNRQNLTEITLSGPVSEAGRRWLTRGNSLDRQPTYSPDGQWILFTSNRTGNLDLWKLSTTTGAVRRITEDSADDWDPAFTPDGRQIVWSSSRSGHFEIWICAADGTGARQLSDDGFDAENPTVTSDGQWVVYNSGSPAKAGIWRIHPDGTGAERIIPGTWSTPDVSPDGRHVAFRTSQEPRTLWVARIADGKILEPSIYLPGNITNARPRWLPDGRSLAFVGTNEAGAQGIFAQAFSPGRDTRGTRRVLAGFDPESPLETFGISPDGAHLTHSAIDNLESIMLAEGLQGITPPARIARRP
jgi:Tol biopolymer transport system component/tRNA A-37 threonylcarbamoyl transferase component Bud32